MKERKKFTKNDPILGTAICVLYSLFLMYETKIGTEHTGTLHGNTLCVPPLFIIGLILIPVINKECRIYWNKRNIIIMILGLLITIPIYIVCSINRYNTFGHWY